MKNNPMSNIEQKVNESASFYLQSILDFDYKLCNYNYKTLQPYFRGNLALELGPASGYMTKYLIEDFKEIHLVEGSLDLLNRIPDYANVKKFHSLFENFSSDVSYDSIVMSHVLEHIENPVEVLKKIYQWLSPDGVFLVSVPNALSIHRLVAVEMGLLDSVYTLNARDKELGHYRVYDLNILESHIKLAGFKVYDTGGIFLKPVSNKQIEENWSDEMIEGFYKAGKYFKENCAEIFIACTK
jgi:SAM-dependent methyltransferase